MAKRSKLHRCSNLQACVFDPDTKGFTCSLKESFCLSTVLGKDLKPVAMRGRSPALGCSPAAACTGTATGRRSCSSRRTSHLEVAWHHQEVLQREWARSPSPCYLKHSAMSKNRFLTVLLGCNFFLGNSVLKY